MQAGDAGDAGTRTSNDASWTSNDASWTDAGDAGTWTSNDATSSAGTWTSNRAPQLVEPPWRTSAQAPKQCAALYVATICGGHR